MRFKKKHILFQKEKQSKKRKILFIFTLIVIITVFFAFQFINRVLTPTLSEYAKEEMRRISNLIINQSKYEEILKKIDMNELYIIHKNTDGEISSIDLNSGIANHILGEVTKKVSEDFKLVESGKVEQLSYYQDIFSDSIDKKALLKGVIFYIPTGLALKNAFFTNLGPKIPVRFHLTGEISSNLKTKITNYGINNALLEINIHLEITEMLILPFSEHPLKVEANYPLTVKMIEGKVPEAFFQGMNQNSPSISLPVS